MSIYGTRSSGRNVTVKDDAILQEKIFPAFCLFTGCTCRMTAQNKITISATRGICCGHDFIIDLTEQTVPLSESGTVHGRIVIVMDLSETEPFSLRAETTAGEFPDLVQDKTPNITNGVYEEVLCTYEANETEISDIQMVAMVKTGSIVTILNGTLAAGETTIAFTDDAITTESMLEFFATIPGVPEPDQSFDEATGTLTLTFEAQEEDMSVKVRVS